MIQTEFPVDTEVLRSRIIETARSMNTQRLNVNKSGNVSARCRAEGGALAFLDHAHPAFRTTISRRRIFRG